MRKLLVLLLALLAQPASAYYSQAQVTLAHPAYACLYVVGPVVVNCALQNTYYEITAGSPWVVNATSNASGSTSGNITIAVNGTYLFHVSAAMDGVNAHNNEWCLFVDGAEKAALETMQTAPAGSAYVNVAGAAIIACTAGQVVDVRIADKTGTGNVNVQKAHFVCTRIGP